MIEALLGSEDAERVLLFLAARQQGYGREIAAFWQTHVSGIQRQLDRFESGGILTRQMVGRTCVYSWNPRWPLRAALQELLDRAIGFLPEEQRQALAMARGRPRRRGKPL